MICACGRGPDAEHADCDWIHGDTIRVTAAELTDAEVTAREAEERRREIGDEWAEDAARDEAQTYGARDLASWEIRDRDDDDGPAGPHFTDDENREHSDWLRSEDGED